VSRHHLAQINVGRLVAPEGDPQVQEFFDNLERINALADASPGFVWRLQSEAGNATDIKPTADPLFIANMSVWETAETLFAYVYKSAHTSVLAKRRDWFERPETAFQALWWVERGHTPSIEEGLSKLWHLDRFGATPHAFTFKSRFAEPGVEQAPVDMQPDPWCVGHA